MKLKICIVISTYNEDITSSMYKSAKNKLDLFGIKKIDTVKVPGAFEIPVAIAKVVKKYDGFIAIGCIIKGETANFDLISKAITDGIMQISITHKKPVGNGIITCLSKRQAMKRSGKNTKNTLSCLLNYYSKQPVFSF